MVSVLGPSGPGADDADGQATDQHDSQEDLVDELGLGREPIEEVDLDGCDEQEKPQHGRKDALEIEVAVRVRLGAVAGAVEQSPSRFEPIRQHAQPFPGITATVAQHGWFLSLWLGYELSACPHLTPLVAKCQLYITK